MTKLKYTGGQQLAGFDREGQISYADDKDAAYLIAHRGHEFKLVSSTNPDFARLVASHKTKPPEHETEAPTPVPVREAQQEK